MSELSEDMSGWPEDDFELLGISRGTDETEIRRAYTRLIRRFKPEKFPDQFQRIRDAFENCKARSQWYRGEPTPEPDPLPQWSKVEATPDGVDQAWQTAVDGDLAGAYAALKREADINDRADLPLRLYWLLAVRPELDTDCTRHEWLAEGLRRSRLSGAAEELYRRELDIDATVVLADPYYDLLGADAATPTLVTMAQIRIDAAGRKRLHHVILHDLRLMKPKLSLDGESSWLGLVTQAALWGSYDRINTELFGYCREELKSLQHLALEHSYAFDRIEESQLWHNPYKFHGLPDEFVRCVHETWAGFGVPNREVVRAAGRAIASKPLAWLAVLGRTLPQIGPDFVMNALMMMSPYAHDDEAMAEEHIRALARQLFHRSSDDSIRDRTLEWLLRDRISPDEFCSALEADPEKRFRKLADETRQDLSLRLVWLACRVQD